MMNRLKFGIGTIKQTFQNLWLAIEGRSITEYCRSRPEYTMYLDTTLLDPSISGMFWPGYMMINDTIISPLDVIKINSDILETGVGSASVSTRTLGVGTITSGKYKDYMFTVQEGGEQF